MVIPEDVEWAARKADSQAVLAWLEAGNDVNDVCSCGWTLLTIIAQGWDTPITDAHVDLARVLLQRGADPTLFRAPEHLSYSTGLVPLKWASRADGPASTKLVALLLEAGADVNQTCDCGHTALGESIMFFNIDAGRSTRDVVALLLRAGASLDDISTSWVRWGVPQCVRSAEELMCEREQTNVSLRMKNHVSYDLTIDETWIAIKDLIARVRAAGSWDEYFNPRKEVLSLRTLALRGRAEVRPDEKSIQFLVDSPDEIVWHVLAYWPAE